MLGTQVHVGCVGEETRLELVAWIVTLVLFVDMWPWTNELCSEKLD